MHAAPTRYEFRVKGELDRRWLSRFEGMTIEYDVAADGGPVTVMSGLVADQSALHGTLAIIRDIGIPIVSIKQIMPD